MDEGQDMVVLCIMELGDDSQYWPTDARQVESYQDAEVKAREWYRGWLDKNGLSPEDGTEWEPAEDPYASIDSMSIYDIQRRIQELEPMLDEGDNAQRPFPCTIWVRPLASVGG